MPQDLAATGMANEARGDTDHWTSSQTRTRPGSPGLRR
jgi:hypothetical protein